MVFSHDMKNEKGLKRKVLLSKGWRTFEVLAVKEAKSKSMNDMFVFTVRDSETKYEEDLYAVATEGKRFFLKQILTACGIQPDEEGRYTWDIPDVVGKEFLGLVDHEENEYINRDMKAVKTTQHRVIDAKLDLWNE